MESPGLGRSRDYQNMDIFDSYSSRSGEIFLTGNYIQVFETNKQCSEVWHKYRYFWRFSTTVTDKAKGTTVSEHDFQAASRRLQVVIHTKFGFSRL